MALDPEALRFFKEQGAIGGKIGGKKRMEMLSERQRKALAKKAAARSAEVRAARKKSAADARAKSTERRNKDS
jgi:uncharacterized protein YdaU (DUF1376 family)